MSVDELARKTGGRQSSSSRSGSTSARGKPSESRTGENPTSDSTRVLEENSTADRVKAPDRKELANSPGTPTLGESGFYSTSHSAEGLCRMERPRVLVFPLALIGFAAVAAGVMLRQTYPNGAVFLMVAGFASISAFLFFHVSYDWIRHRQATSLLSQRTQLNSGEFAAKFFPESQNTAAKLRDSLAEYLELDLAGLLPDDDLNAICDAQTDDPSLVWHLEQDFELGETFAEYEEFCQIEKSIRTFRELLEFVQNRCPNS